MKTYPPANPAFPHMLHGGDYNPDQWLHVPGTLDEDMRLMKLAHVNVASIGIFSWAMIEPEENKFEFGWLDTVMDTMAKNNVKAVLATPSGAKPHWLAIKYPEIRRVQPNGLRDPQMERHNHCPTSPVYRQKVRMINRKLAERYREHPALFMWHVSNEYGGECHCDLCKDAFRAWLKKRYGSIPKLNEAWWSAFWSHKYADWGEVIHIDRSVHGLVLDWKRFVTDQTIDFFLNEIAPLRAMTPKTPVTINMMGTYPGLDYWKFAQHLDVVSWDNYPNWHGQPDEWREAPGIAMTHDINRCIKGGQPFILMESTPSATNWQRVPTPKRPGMHRLSSLQAVAHGSDAVMYFQWRKGRGSCEKFHGAVVDHVGHENTRVFREVAALGEELEKLDPIVGTSVEPQVALVYDWENRWAIEEAQGPRNANKDYHATVLAHYLPFWRRGIPVDVINEDCDITKYKLVIAPMMYMVRPGVAERIAAFVEQGGTFVATYLTGIANESDLCFTGGFPGPLSTLLGIWVEETDVLGDHHEQSVVPLADNELGLDGAYVAQHYADIVRIMGAKVLASFGAQFYKGSPAVTVNAVGNGKAYYIASRNEEKFTDTILAALAKSLQIGRSVEAELPEGVTAQMRSDAQADYVFLMNFNGTDREVALDALQYTDATSGEQVAGTLALSAYGCRILKRQR